jgi:glycosyltransferase involved in cell wall biosynthesis
MSTQSWSIVVLGYNEAGSLLRVVDDVEAVLREMAPTAFEIIVVDDGSTDDSARVIREQLEPRPHVRAFFHERNLGIGEALRTGYRAARLENVVAVPGDGQFDVRELLPYAALPPRTLISFTRRAVPSYSRVRRLITGASQLLNERLAGLALSDPNWVKLWKRADFLALGDLEIHSSLVQSEICAKLLAIGCVAVEPTSRYLARQSGVSRGVSPKIMLQALRDVVSLVRVVRAFRRSHPRA